MPAAVSGITFSRSLHRMLERWANAGHAIPWALYAGCTQGQRTPIRLCPDAADFIDFKGELLSFMPGGKTQRFDDTGAWAQDGRQAGKPARVARALIDENDHHHFLDTDFETFANLVKGHAAQQSGTFHEFTGEAIRTLYLSSHTQPGSGSLDKSCMRYETNQPFFDLYCQNPDQVALLALVNQQGRVIGRSLLWTTQEYGRVMDRVYGLESTQAAFREWAIKEGIPYRLHNSVEMPRRFVFPQGRRDVDLSVRVDHWRHDFYPYCDTFVYLHENTGLLANHEPDDGSFSYILQSTHGGPRLRVPCRRCKQLISPDNWMEGGMCYDCWHATHCPRCQVAVDPDEATDGYCATCVAMMTCRECRAFTGDALYGDKWCYSCAIKHQCNDCGYIGEDVETRPNPHDQRCRACQDHRRRLEERRAALPPTTMSVRLGEMQFDVPTTATTTFTQRLTNAMLGGLTARHDATQPHLHWTDGGNPFAAFVADDDDEPDDDDDMDLDFFDDDDEEEEPF